MINEIAVEYVKHGLALVSMPRGGKSPTTLRWNERGNTATDSEQAGTLTGNVGLAHAYCTPIPTAALDLDDLELAAAWLLDRGVDLDAIQNSDDAVQIVSGKKGRAKLLYRLPVGTLPMESIQIKGGEPERVILEFRCATVNGLTVQDVLPPSIHPETGKPYKWGGKGDWRRLPEIPVAVRLTWQEELQTRHYKKRRHKQSSYAAMSKAVDDTPRQRARLAEMTGKISADCPYELYRDIVWAHLSLGWHDAEELAKQWCKTAPHRFEEADFNQVIASYDVTRTPTFGTIIYHARLGGWHE